MPKVFVYGTLLSGEGNNRYFLTGSELRGTEVVHGFSMYDLGSFPACVPDEKYPTPIIGEVWEVSEETFQRLDHLEGYPSFYNRVEVDTFDGKAWMYINEHLHKETDGGSVILYPKITSGSWKQRLKEKYG